MQSTKAYKKAYKTNSTSTSSLRPVRSAQGHTPSLLPSDLARSESSRVARARFSSASSTSPAFTIVELLIVIVVIGILTAVIVVSFTNLSGQANIASLQSDLKQAHTALGVYNVENGTYPTTEESATTQTQLTSQNNTTYTYTHNSDTNTYCLQATNTSLTEPNQSYHITNEGIITEGECGGEAPSPLYMQTITQANCPSTRTMAIDARDNHTYWVQRITNEDSTYNQCWMLTNLAYAGDTSNGGTSDYGDIIPTGDGTLGTLNNGSSDGFGAQTLIEAKYYIHTNANPTVYPAEPSTSTDGGATNPQYGYLYNWCAAMGAQNGGSKPSTSACANATTPEPDTSISICPTGWRLPTGIPGVGEYPQLTGAINVASVPAPQASINLRESWLAQLGGNWRISFDLQGDYGYNWSSTQSSATNAYHLRLDDSNVSSSAGSGKDYGFSVRCVAV
jgi:uncharacterized protein (TIGR02145 family)